MRVNALLRLLFESTLRVQPNMGREPPLMTHPRGGR
jgi:hypothetical protein